MAHTYGTMVRNGFTDTAIIMGGYLGNVSVLEVKRNNVRNMKNVFSSVDEWATSLGVEASTLTYSERNSQQTNGAPSDGAPTNGARTNGSPTNGSPTNGSPTNGSPRTKALLRMKSVFRYEAGTPDWAIAKDIVSTFGGRSYSSIYDPISIKNEITKCQIALLKMELDPPEFEMLSWSNSLEAARGYQKTHLIVLRKKLEEVMSVDCSVFIRNPRVFIKKDGEMLPLNYHQEKKKVVVNSVGYDHFYEYTPSPEIWVHWHNKMTLIDIQRSA